MFEYRSQQAELLDADDIPQAALFRNLYELDIINHYLGGYAVSYDALAKVLRHDKTYTLVDIGSGGGDTLKRIKTWATTRDLRLRLVGMDYKADCIQYATEHAPDPALQFIHDDYRRVLHHLSAVDILHASLFCHHLSDDALVALIQFALQHNMILIINDLHRHPMAYYAIKIITKIASKSYLVKNDAPLSVLRGFTKAEWITLLRKAGATRYSIAWKWAFRHQIIIYA